MHYLIKDTLNIKLAVTEYRQWFWVKNAVYVRVQVISQTAGRISTVKQAGAWTTKCVKILLRYNYKRATAKLKQRIVLQIIVLIIKQMLHPLIERQ
jgi:hypothetical protein